MICFRKVKGRTLSPDSIIIDTYDDNPILNTLTCDAEFEDGDVREHMANVIGKNMLSRADADGHVTMLLHAITNHRKNDASYELRDKHFYVNNQKNLRKPTKGWDLEVAWQDGTTDWLPLKDVKKSTPAEVA